MKESGVPTDVTGLAIASDAASIVGGRATATRRYRGSLTA